VKCRFISISLGLLYFYFTGVYPVKFFEKDSEVDLTGASLFLFHWGKLETGNWLLLRISDRPALARPKELFSAYLLIIRFDIWIAAAL